MRSMISRSSSRSNGIVVNKFWLHISQDEQLRRFKERQTVAYKQYKITDEDWRNRQKWDAYKLVVNELVTRCSTEYARGRWWRATTRNSPVSRF